MPLFRKGDKFVIVGRNSDKNLMPIEAKSLRDGWIYFFNEDELEEIK